jgi:uncharacterized membrane protein (UPF0182 family)
MKRLSWSKKVALWAGAALAAVTVLGILAWVANVWTDYQWYLSVGQQDVFWTTSLSQAAVWLVFAVAGFVVLHLSTRAAWRVISEKPRLVRVTAFACAVLAAALAAAMSQQWMVFRLAASGQSFGVPDLQFGSDVGFFVFVLPAFELLYQWLNGLTFVAVVAVAAITASSRMRVIDTIPVQWAHLKRILFRLAGLLMIAVSLNYWIAVWRISYSPAGQIFGASYSDIVAALPAFWIMCALSAALALMLFVQASSRAWKAVFVTTAVYATAALLLTVVWPWAVQTYIATPNEATLEQPYRARNIAMTRAAFDLSAVEGVQYAGLESLSASASADAARVLADATVWTPDSVGQAFNQLQTIRPYYKLSAIDFDRYRIGGELRQVLVAARQIDPKGLPSNAQTWVNTHLVYTHGYGLAISSASKTTNQGFPTFLVGDVPSVVASSVASEAISLEMDEPRIYFGPDMTGYAVVNTGIDEFDYPAGDKNATTRYSAGGTPVGSFLSRLAWSVRLGSDQLLFSGYVKADSRILLYRGVKERAAKLAPWLTYDEKPYPAIVDGRVVWILDAYTSSDHYPNSQPLASGVNYLRNSVKVVMDAYSGEIHFYANGTDPIRDAWATIYPSIITSQDQMPASVADHLRAPVKMFSAQADAYRAYHMTDPTVFYSREDLWDVPKDAAGKPMQPSYLMLDLPDAAGAPTGKAMYLLQPFSLPNRDNLVGWMATACDPGKYGTRTVYLLPKSRVTLGPRNIAARINQDPRISQQLTLWSQPGNSVLFGTMLVMPVENSVAYVQPVFLQAQDNAMTQLVSVIVVNGDRVEFASTLVDALARAYAPVRESVDTSGAAPVDATP